MLKLDSDSAIVRAYLVRLILDAYYINQRNVDEESVVATLDLLRDVSTMKIAESWYYTTNKIPLKVVKRSYTNHSPKQYVYDKASMEPLFTVNKGLDIHRPHLHSLMTQLVEDFSIGLNVSLIAKLEKLLMDMRKNKKSATAEVMGDSQAKLYHPHSPGTVKVTDNDMVVCNSYSHSPITANELDVTYFNLNELVLPNPNAEFPEYLNILYEYRDPVYDYRTLDISRRLAAARKKASKTNSIQVGIEYLHYQVCVSGMPSYLYGIVDEIPLYEMALCRSLRSPIIPIKSYHVNR